MTLSEYFKTGHIRQIELASMLGFNSSMLSRYITWGVAFPEKYKKEIAKILGLTMDEIETREVSEKTEKRLRRAVKERKLHELINERKNHD